MPCYIETLLLNEVVKDAMIINLVLFVAGFILLLKGADYLVDGSYSVAKRFNISELAIGLTIVALGTSMPELIVNIAASFKGASDIAIGNVFGSNIVNILLILGVSAIIRPLPLQKQTILSEIPFTIIATLLVGFLANAALLANEKQLLLSRLDGVILLFFFMIYMLYIVKTCRDTDEDVAVEEHKIYGTGKSIILIVIGILALMFGGRWVVDGAVELSTLLGISKGFVGLTIVAFGTSLPELVTSVQAARKGSIDISVGNIVGSNIFNLLLILGVSSIIKPLPFEGINNIDIMIMLSSSLLIIFSTGIGVKDTIDRKNGVWFVLFYLVYVVYLVKRG